MLQLTHIQSIRNNQSLFAPISFMLRPGEILQVTGNNGAGKTSLLRIAVGLLKPHAGEVFWDNELIEKSKTYFDQLFYLGHLLAIKPELTIKENILYFQNRRKQPQHIFSGCTSKNLKMSLEFEIEKKLEKWALNPFKNNLAKTLSQGQKQRLALARLELSSAKVWVLDEPFSNLDVNAISQLETLFQCHVEKGGMILISTHQRFQLQTNINVLEITL